MTRLNDIYRAQEMHLASREGSYAEIVNPPKDFKGDEIDRFGFFSNVAKQFVFNPSVEKETLMSVFLRHEKEGTPFYVPVQYTEDEEGNEALDIFVVDPGNKKVTFCSSSGEVLANLIDKKTQAVFDQIHDLAQGFVFTVKI